MAKNSISSTNWKRILAVAIFVLQSISDILDKIEKEEAAEETNKKIQEPKEEKEVK